MADTLTDSGELTFASFAIEKSETTEDGDIIVYGKCSDGDLDHDEQIVSPSWMREASRKWLDTGANLRVNHNPQRDPAGIGLDVSTDSSGATWLKGLIVEPIAKKLVSKGALRAFSVGIARPTIERDVTGKARGGVIKGGELIEISLVDRPANARCRFQLAKSAAGAPAEYVGKVLGDSDDIAKALGEPDAFKSASYADAVNNIDSFSAPADMNIDFTPNDLMKILQEKMVARSDGALAAYKEVMESETEALSKSREWNDSSEAFTAKDHREFSADRRRSLASSGNALPDGSYPIPDKDALRRAAILARSGHGNVAAARRLIARRAKELGVPNPLDADDKAKKQLAELEKTYRELGLLQEGESLDLEKLLKRADPDHDGDDDSTAKGDTDHDYWSADGKQKKPLPSQKAAAPDGDDDDDEDEDSSKEATADVVKKPPMPKPKKGKKGKKMPPWLNKPSGDDAEKAAKMTDPKTASGAEEAADMDCAPLGSLVETPAKPHMKGYMDVMLRYKTVGIDADLGKLHDFTCPAYNPQELSTYFPQDEFSTLIDERVWQQKALSAAAGKSISEAMDAQRAWQAASTLRAADPRDTWAYRMEAHKAFRDANPGPTSAPTPCAMSPQKFNRPLITDGHSASSPGHDGPNSSSSVASGTPNAHHFDRPPLSSGHQSPSPSFMKGGFEYPETQGVPTHLDYGVIEREKSRQALATLHEHLMHMFPAACPILDQDPYQQQSSRPVPPTEGLSKSQELAAGEEVLGDVYKIIRKLEKKVREGKITEAQAREELSRKTAEKYARSLARQVEKGLTSKDAVLKALGIEAPAPAPAPATPAPEQVNKFAYAGEPQTATLQSSFTPDLIKSAMAEMLAPLQEKIDAQTSHITEQENLLSEYKQKVEGAQAELAEHRQRWDALASQPDPSTAAFTGLALSPAAKGASPAGVTKQADASERVQGMMIRQLERAWRTSENPAEREAAYNALQRYKGMSD